MKTVAGYLLLIAILSSQVAIAESIYQIHHNSVRTLTETEILKLNNFFEEVTHLLPKKMSHAFQQKISVQFKNIENLHGHANLKSGITLNENLLQIIIQSNLHTELSVNPNGQIRTHKTKIQEARGTLIHETAHLYDFMNIRPINEKNFIDNCRLFKSTNKKNVPLPDQCEVYLDTKTTLSSNPYYLELAGWPLSVQGLNYREPNNLFRHRTADALEFKNSIEHFAVNFEYYLLDPDFKCRKPLLTKYFDQHFEVKKSDSYCLNNFYVNPSSSNPEQIVRQIPFERVYQIHYLHADKGNETMSSWGHSMFRIVICDPKRKSIGPECLRDEYYHIVISFRAFIDTFSISSWKGLTGSYPSRLFIVPFEEVKKNYLQIELRDLISYPLNISENEKIRFLERALDIHWNYDSSYYFLTNNCASDSLNLLKSSLLRAEIIEKKIIKPTDLRNLLLKTHLISAVDFKNEKIDAMEKGFYFENHGHHFVAALSFLKGQQENLSSAIDHISLPYTEREKFYASLTSDTNIKSIAAISILEKASLDFTKSKVNESIMMKAVKSMDTIRNSYQLSINYFNLFSAPHEFINSESYGIPNDLEIRESLQKIQITWNNSINNNINRKKLIESLFSDDQKNEIQKTEQKLNHLTTQLRYQK